MTPGAYLAGYLEVADIGLEAGETEHARVTREILDRVPRRGPEDTKYTAGHVVVVGGSPGMTGAPCLSAKAAFRADAGTSCSPGQSRRCRSSRAGCWRR